MKSTAELELSYDNALKSLARFVGVAPAESTEETARALEHATAHNLHPSHAWFVSGISGSGKTTIVDVLRRNGFRRIPNVVTRPRRPEEAPGENVFVDDTEFDRMERSEELFHPHITNGVKHAMRISDIEILVSGDMPSYLDKSVPSVLDLLGAYPALATCTFVYILPPSFTELHQRITSRESAADRAHALTEQQISERFEEEIEQMKYSTAAPYAYIMNDSVERVRAQIETQI